MDALERAGLLAPAGEVDKVLNTVVNNLEVTNNLDIQPEIRCRVLLTSNLEFFSIGHTIVVSRGLIDVLPDEATLATILAQEIADAMVLKPSFDVCGFSDMSRVEPTRAVERFSFRSSKYEAQNANEKALQLLRNSSYRDKLANAGLFLEQLHLQERALMALINPRLGNQVSLSSQLMATAPALKREDVDQIAALPMGAGIKLDPWTDTVELVKAKRMPLLSAREKTPFEITPFMPYLSRCNKAEQSATPKAKDSEGPQAAVLHPSTQEH